MPVLEFPPAIPSTDQLTVELLNPCTVAVNCFVPDGAKVTARGEMVITYTVTAAVADSSASVEFAAMIV